MPIRAFRRVDGLGQLMRLIDAREVKIQSAYRGLRLTRIRKQLFGRGRLNPGQCFGGRTAARGQRHETFAISVQRQDAGDPRTVCSCIKLHAQFHCRKCYRTRTALVLSGGGMFGAYQAGAWKTLSREFSPDIVVGTSVGALNGWCIAGGLPAEELERRWLDPSSGAVMTYRTRRAPWQSVFDPGPLEDTARQLVNSCKLRLEYGVALVELPAFRRRLVSNGD